MTELGFLHVTFLAGFTSSMGNIGEEIATIKSCALRRVVKFQVGTKPVALATENRFAQGWGFCHVNELLIFMFPFLGTVYRVRLRIPVRPLVNQCYLVMADHTADVETLNGLLEFFSFIVVTIFVGLLPSAYSGYDFTGNVVGCFIELREMTFGTDGQMLNGDIIVRLNPRVGKQLK